MKNKKIHITNIFTKTRACKHPPSILRFPKLRGGRYLTSKEDKNQSLLWIKMTVHENGEPDKNKTGIIRNKYLENQFIHITENE